MLLLVIFLLFDVPGLLPKIFSLAKVTFKHVHICPLSTFVIAPLKYVPYNAYISVVSVLAWLFFIQFNIFFFLGEMHTFC